MLSVAKNAKCHSSPQATGQFIAMNAIRKEKDTDSGNIANWKNVLFSIFDHLTGAKIEKFIYWLGEFN